MADKLAGLVTGGPETQAINHVIQSKLQHAQKILAGDTLLPVGHLEVASELTFHDAVDPSGLLFFTELDPVIGMLDPTAAVLSRGIGPSLDGTLVGITAVPFEEELRPFPPAKPTDGFPVSCQFKPP